MSTLNWDCTIGPDERLICEYETVVLYRFLPQRITKMSVAFGIC